MVMVVVVLLLVTYCGKGSGGFWAAKLGSEWEFNSGY
jgi:hypothetical protein